MKARRVASLSEASANAVGQEVAITASFRNEEVKQTEKMGRVELGPLEKGEEGNFCVL